MSKPDGKEANQEPRTRVALIILLIYSGVFAAIWLKVLFQLLSGGAVSG